MADDLLSSEFDPLLYLQSEPPDIIPFDAEPDPESFADDLEALEERRIEIAEQNRRNRVVIQSRTWKLSDVFRSDDDIRPITPTRPRYLSDRSTPSGTDLPSTPPMETMPFISTPVNATSSSPPRDVRKRKSEAQPQIDEAKRQKVTGGFVDEEDDNNNDFDDDDRLLSLQQAHEESNRNERRMIGGFVEDDEDEDALAELQANYPNSSIASLELKTPVVHGPFVDDDDDYDAMNALRNAQTESDASLLQTIATQPVSGTRLTGQNSHADLRTVRPANAPEVVTPTRETVTIKTCAGTIHKVASRERRMAISYERLVAGRSAPVPGKAQRSYYGIEIHRLLDETAQEKKEVAESVRNTPQIQQSIEDGDANPVGRKASNPMWTEKYRARKFTDLIGDERTHRSVLRWLKAWEPIVFPGLAKPKQLQRGNDELERAHRKILMLTGPPGLGKTTLAHVCARQAGYEVLEINASDERSKDVVKGRIRDAVGTENVKSVGVGSDPKTARKAARPVCVVVDEVDGVVGGSGSGGEGGFIKALIDLVMTDQKNAARGKQVSSSKKKRGDNFRLLRPMILICNDVYHPSLRPLRTANVAEVIHVRHVPLENVIQRLKMILGREKITYDNDGVRRLCEAAWGIGAKKDRTDAHRGIAEGDIRSVLVSAEWVARKLRSMSSTTPRLTRRWLEESILESQEGFSEGLGRGGVREIVDRVFLEGAGFPTPPLGADSFNDPFEKEKTKTPVGVADLRKRHAISKLREMVETSGDYDRCITDCFLAYPLKSFQDDTYLSKPNSAYDWLHFHDMISSKVFSNQDWELNPYLSQPVVAFHHLFASAKGSAGNSRAIADIEEEQEEHPFSGPKADFAAFEALKQNKSILSGFQSTFCASLLRLFRSLDSVATDLVPNLMRMLSPDVKPVVVRGSEQKSVASVRKESEKALVRAAVRVMAGLNLTFEKVRVENAGAHEGWVYRLEPPIDTLVGFSKVKGTALDVGGSGPVRYAIRQVLEQEYRKEMMRKQSLLQTKHEDSGKSGDLNDDEDKENAEKKAKRDMFGAKRDFFGRIINESLPTMNKHNADQSAHKRKPSGQKQEHKVWLTFHEGFSNAVRKPISMTELLAEL